MKNILKIHKKINPKIETRVKTPLKTKKDLAIYYTPGIGEVVKEIIKSKKNAKFLTIKQNSVAVISDGSAVLGFGNVGDLASLPVMEGKAILFKRLAGINAYPIVIKSQNIEEMVNTIKNISGGFSAINLEDISAPKCFEIEDKLKKECDIPVIHDDQHATSIAVIAGLINALKVANKNPSNCKIVISGAGAAGYNIVKAVKKYGFRKILALDSKGIISETRKDLNKYKMEIAKITNSKLQGTLKDAIIGADIFIGVSTGNIFKKEWVKLMNKKPIIFALANPTPEIDPKEALKSGAFIVATGRSDFKNQINNAIVFPGLFKLVIKKDIRNINEDVKIKIAKRIAGYTKKPSRFNIITSPLSKGLANLIANTPLD